MALIKTADQRLPLNNATNVSVNTTIRTRFFAGYSGEGGIPDLDVTGGYASLSVDGQTVWDNLPVEGSSSSGDLPTCFTPALTLIAGTVYTWVAYAEMYVNQPGHGAPFTTTITSSQFTFTTAGVAPRQITLTSPTDEDTGVLLQPLLQWAIGGAGATEGDLLDIYLRKDDANFTDDDLLAGLVDATLNSSLRVVAGLEYDATYYWQVQAFASEEDDLLSSSVFSFTVQSFSPPAYSVHPVSGLPTGESNQITVRRLVAIANNKFWYEGT